MKNKIYTALGLFIIFLNNSFAKIPTVPELGLPGDSLGAEEVTGEVGGNLISTFIQYVAIIAVIALMLSGIMYLIANGEEEKTKKAKNWIIWSLVGVLLSISAWGIINIINNLTINN